MAAPRSPYLLEILNYFFALISAGKVKIDVRPLAALFRKKSLEQQFHADRIDSRDSKRIAHCAIGCRSAALYQDVLLAAETNNVPDNQEIPFKFQPFDKRQFAFDLNSSARLQIGGGFSIAIAKTFTSTLT